MAGRKAKLHIDERRDRSLDLSSHWSTIATQHRAAEARHIQRDQAEKAQFRREAAEKAEFLARKHGRAADRFAKAAARARTARRLNEEVSAERVEAAIALAGDVREPEKLSPKEARRRQQRAEKQARLSRQAEAERQRELKRANVDHDPRIAAGQREIIVRGPTIDKRASFSDYGSLIARQSERTAARIRAMEKYDGLVHQALAGEMPGPKFERGVDVSHGATDHADGRADAHMERDRLRNAIGPEFEAILFHRVFHRMTFGWMAQQEIGMGKADVVAVMFLSAVDAAARHFGYVQRPSRAVEAMEQHELAG